MNLLSSLLILIGFLSLIATPFTFGASAAGAVVAFLISGIIEESAAARRVAVRVRSRY